MEVLISPTFLNTLNAREMKCGFGEVVKYAALSGEIFELLEAQENLQEKLKDLDFLKSIIEACVQYKASVVEADERDKNERKALNLGHTTGHAIELAGGLSHGESVLVGMFLETKIAMICGVCEMIYGEKLLRLISRALALEPVCEDGYNHAVAYAENAKADKKNENREMITMSVAKAKGEWSLLSLPFARYKTLLQELGDWQ